MAAARRGGISKRRNATEPFAHSMGALSVARAIPIPTFGPDLPLMLAVALALVVRKSDGARRNRPAIRRPRPGTPGIDAGARRPRPVAQASAPASRPISQAHAVIAPAQAGIVPGDAVPVGWPEKSSRHKPRPPRQTPSHSKISRVHHNPPHQRLPWPSDPREGRLYPSAEGASPPQWTRKRAVPLLRFGRLHQVREPRHSHPARRSLAPPRPGRVRCLHPRQPRVSHQRARVPRQDQGGRASPAGGQYAPPGWVAAGGKHACSGGNFPSPGSFLTDPSPRTRHRGEGFGISPSPR